MRGRSVRRAMAAPVAHGRRTAAVGAGAGGSSQGYDGVSNAASGTPSGRRGHRRRPVWPYFAVTLTLLAAIAAIGGYLWYQSFFADTITPGVFIDGQAVGGQNAEEVRARLHAQADARVAAMKITITGEGKTWTIAGDDLNPSKNIDDVIDQIKPLGRTGSFAARREQAVQVQAQAPNYPLEMQVDQSALRQKIEAIAAEVNLEGHDATVSFDPEKDSIPEMFQVVPETRGLTVDVDAMMERIAADLKAGDTSTQQLVTSEYQPKVTEAMLQESFHEVTSFKTKVGGIQDRKENIKLALSRFNGMVIYPGQQVSFNATTGERSEANGYRMANVIGPDKVYVPDWGGGVCQASTTLYNGVLRAGLQIDERSHHSIPSDYVDLGFDAMVNWPNRDFKFTNNTDRPIYIKSWASDRYAYVTFYGKELPDGQTIGTKSELITRGKLPDPEIRPDTKGQYTDKVTYVDDEYVVMKSHEYIKVRAHRIWKGANGEVIKDEVLYTDEFKELPGLIVTGTKQRLQPEPSSTPKTDDQTE